MTETALEPRSQHDLARKPVSAFLWWCLPIAIGIASGSAGLTLRENATVWAVAFTWMAAGCFLNALRCHRLHCYFSGPAFLGGALVAGAVASGVDHLSSSALNYDIAATFVLVLLSFTPEAYWRKYI
jgi:hypothetical protein